MWIYLPISHGEISAGYDRDGNFIQAYVTRYGEHDIFYKDEEDAFNSFLDYLGINIKNYLKRPEEIPVCQTESC